MAIGECTDLHWKTQRRKALVDQHWEEMKYICAPVVNQLSDDEYKKHDSAWIAAINTYNAEIPLIKLSRCPICHDKLLYGIDVLGLEGMRWDVDLPEGDTPRIQCCEHFRALTGAIDFHGRDPVEAYFPATGTRQIQPGPGVPFVMPHVLSHTPGMVAVIASFEGPHGDTYYPIAYFSPQPASPRDLPPAWSRQTLKIYGSDGQIKGWTMTNHVWDFELQPWVDTQQLMWIAPGKVHIKNHGPCPYVNLPGTRQPQLIEKDKVLTMYLPDGSNPNPFSE